MSQLRSSRTADQIIAFELKLTWRWKRKEHQKMLGVFQTNVGGFPKLTNFWGFSKTNWVFWRGFWQEEVLEIVWKLQAMPCRENFGMVCHNGLPFQKQLKLPSPTIWVLHGITEVMLRLQLILLIHFNCHGEMTTTPGKPQAKPQYLTSSPLSKYNGYECKYTMKIVYAFQICTYSICYR